MPAHFVNHFQLSVSVSLFFCRFLIALASCLWFGPVWFLFLLLSYLYLFLYQFRRMKIGLDTNGGGATKTILIVGSSREEGGGGLYGV